MMNAKEVAGALREIAVKHLATAGEVAAGLYALAGSIDPPRTMSTTLANSATCDVCGDQIAGLRWIGEPCVASAPGMRPCVGRYRLDPEPDEESQFVGCIYCQSTFTRQVYLDSEGSCPVCGEILAPYLEADEQITTADGTELGVTRDRLAFEAAMMTFLADDPDNDEAIDAVDVASGCRGSERK